MAVPEAVGRPRSPPGSGDAQRDLDARFRRLAAHAAHDLQEPLRLVAGYLDILKAHQEGRAEVDAARITEQAAAATERMQRLVADLLDFATIDAPGPEVEPVDLGDVVAEAKANLDHALRATDAVVDVVPLPVVPGHRLQLVRLVQNLLDNSLKYRADGTPVRIRIGCRQHDGGWVLTVEDNGIGFPREGRDRLFDPFFRAHDRAVPGTGLGLATVRSVAEQHGGTVRALDSDLGGACVQITLAAYPEAPS